MQVWQFLSDLCDKREGDPSRWLHFQSKPDESGFVFDTTVSKFNNQVSFVRMSSFCYHLAFWCHLEKPSSASFKKELIDFCPCIVQTLGDKKCDTPDTAEKIYSILREKNL